ncbi:uncharacterized protein LOC131243780 isoform X2 [Magnolia sinica]|uniref:uncharacterized protein LOC131243780 isoform X2 n=1 Tax=Magnolia sinica TaxID=86752 RepID=UPI002658BED9|nr:uncharacterized protein LOC131243780 isoform X2 [Magnolia sinica]
MHGIPLPLKLSPSQSHLSLENCLRFSIPTCRFCHGIYFSPLFLSPNPQTLWNSFCRYKNKKNNNRRIAVTVLRASFKESPYDVLGVPPSATPDQIKRAYRKLALKFHPDVNKEANAQEKFMRIKHAYNTLLNSESKRNYDFGNRTSGYSNSASEKSRSRNGQDEEDFYGFEDLFRDLQTEFQNWEASAGSQGKPKSLWEELADIGEEFVEFLEKELNITDSNIDSKDGDDGSVKGDPYGKSGSERSGDDIRNEARKESSIEENIDEIEAALAQLKKELGL